MKHEVAIMEILEAFDLLGTYRAAGNLVGCSPNTVKRYVQARDSGEPVPRRVVRARLTDPFEDKIWELVDRSRAWGSSGCFSHFLLLCFKPRFLKRKRGSVF